MLGVEGLKALVRQYELDVDFFPTKYPKHATELARSAQKEGYDVVLVAGGDGTVGEAANGLVHTDIPLGIIPLGTFMNVCKMLSIPLEIEKALLLIKIGKTHKIDLGSVTSIGGKVLQTPYYFIESVGVGLEASIQKSVLAWERADYKSAWESLKLLLTMYRRPVTVRVDEREVCTRARLITIANGPLSGANLELAPEAELNDHKLLVSIFGLSKFEFIQHFWNLLRQRSHRSASIQKFFATTVKVRGADSRMVHADARLFGNLPIECEVVPNALCVITGFPEDRSGSAVVESEYFDL